MAIKSERFMHKGKQWSRWLEDNYECWVVGVDLGQRQDYTAISAIQHLRIPYPDDWDVNERTCTIRQKVDERFLVRGLERLPLNMDYPQQARRIKTLFNAPPLNGRGDLVVDDAGVGAPVCDQFIVHGQLNPIRVTLTGVSDQVTRKAYRRYTIPKLLMVSHIDARLNTGELQFADDLALREVARDELLDFQRHVTAAGRATFEARGGKHDDIVNSIGLALWWCLAKRQINHGSVSPVRGLY